MSHHPDADAQAHNGEPRRTPNDPFLIHGLRQLAIDPRVEVAADFHATVMAKARALLPPQPRIQDRLGAWLPALAPALAVALVLSVCINIWWGIGPLGQRQPTPVQLLRTAQFQRQITSAQPLGTLMPASSTREDEAKAYGFTPLPEKTRLFRIGTGYAEALAFLASGHLEPAAARLASLTLALDAVQAPPALSAYLREMRVLLQGQRYTSAVLTQFVALFEPLYEAGYTQQPEAAGLVWFQTGAWLETMSLAAAAGDRAALRQGPVVQYFRTALHRLDASPQVLEAMQRLHHLVTQPTLSDQDVAMVRTLVTTIQGILSH